MWFIADAWARSRGGHSDIHHHGGDYPTDNETGFALIVGAILILIGWLAFEFFNIYREKRARPIARATRHAIAPSMQLDGRRLNDRVRSVKIEEE